MNAMTNFQKKAEPENEGNGSRQFASNNLNIKHETGDILKTVVLLEDSMGLSYIMNVLRGAEVEWIKKEHQQLETFGALCGQESDRIRTIVNFMIDRELIKPSARTGNTIEITAEGRAFLDNPADLLVSPGFLRTKRYTWGLRRKLWELRRDIARKNEEPAYQVMSELTVERLTHLMPANLQELQSIPGLTSPRIDEFGHALLQIISSFREMRKNEALQKIKRVVKSRTYQEAKELFNQGKSIAEIAETKGIKDETVINYLGRLHRTGDIDLKPWIEANLNGEELYRAADYFKKVQNPRLKEAHEVLGIGYPTLRLALLYIQEIAPESPLPVPS